jgi:hypothetical protein
MNYSSLAVYCQEYERKLNRPVGNGVWANETCGTGDEFHAGLFVVVELRFVPSRNHLAFPVANHRHIHGEISFGYSELLASADVGSDPRAVYNILAGETGDVRARSANVFALNRRDALSLPRKSPGSDGTSGATADDHQIILFRGIPGQTG